MQSPPLPSRVVSCCGALAALALVACSGDAAKPKQSTPDGGSPVGGRGASGVTGGGVGGVGGLAGGGTAGGTGVGGIGADADAGPDAGAQPDLDAGVDAGPTAPCVCDGSLAPTLACEDECKVAFSPLFADDQLASFYLTLFADNAGGGNASSWDNVMDNCTQGEASSKTPPLECDYQVATFHAEYDPAPSDGMAESVVTAEIEVGVHRKGRASWDDSNTKPGLKIKFTEFGGERFLGLTRLTLNNSIQDPSMLRERVAYAVYRAAGVPAPLANSAKLYIRDSATSAYEYFGVYVNVQTLDRRFVESHYGEVNNAVGNLFDTYNDVYFTELDRASCRDQAGPSAGAQEARFELETNETLDDRSDLTALIDSVFKTGCSTSFLCTGGNCCCNAANWDQSSFFETLSTRADTGEFLRAFAVQALITDWDGYAGTRNNFKLYHDLVSGKFVIFPWGTDQTFGYQDNIYYPNWRYALNHTNSNRTRSLFMIRCEDDPTDCYDKYLTAVDDAQMVFASMQLGTLIDAWEAQIEDAVLADTHKNAFYDDTRFRRNVDALRQYVASRATCVTQLLGGSACASASCPTGMSDCNTSGN